LLASVMVLMGTTMAVSDERQVVDRPVMAAGRPVAELQGVWRSRGYGYLLRVGAGGGGLELFHVAGGFCYPDPRRAHDPDGLFGYYRPLEDGTVAFSGTPGQTRIVFDRVSELPAACQDRTPWTPQRITALVAATFTDLYPSFAERGIDWPARAASVERLVAEAPSGNAALFKTLQTLLAGIEDPHMELHAEIAGKERTWSPGEAKTLLRVRTLAALGSKASKRERAWRRAYHRGIEDSVLEGDAHWGANDCALWGRVDDIGYLNLMCMEGFTERAADDDPSGLDAALDDAITAFQGARAVIVDITDNDGGYDMLAQRIAGRFTDQPRLAYTKVAFGAKGVEPQAFHVEPSGRMRYTGPVYLLTSDITISAAEVFTLCMRALPNVVHLGETTRGAFSDQVDKPLPNGWLLVLSAEVYRDPQGRSYEVSGLPPHLERQVFPPDDLVGGHARRVLAVMDEIRRGSLVAVKP
jgi:carboxyl-terminal processing protease